MKKVLMFLALILGFVSLGRATDITFNPQGSYNGTSFYSTTASIPSGQGWSIQVATVTKNGQNCRYGIKHIYATLSSGTTGYIIDGSLTGGTTAQVIYGANLPSNQYENTRPALDPWLLTSGIAFSLNVPAPAVATAQNDIEVDGETFCTTFQNNGTGPN